MLELIGWIQRGELMDKLTSPLFWFTLAAFCIAGHYVGEALFNPNAQSEKEE